MTHRHRLFICTLTPLRRVSQHKFALRMEYPFAEPFTKVHCRVGSAALAEDAKTPVGLEQSQIIPAMMMATSLL